MDRLCIEMHPADAARGHDCARADIGRIDNGDDGCEERVEAQAAVDEQDAPVGQRRGVADLSFPFGVVKEAKRLRAGHRRIAGIDQRFAPARIVADIFGEYYGAPPGEP